MDASHWPPAAQPSSPYLWGTTGMSAILFTARKWRDRPRTRCMYGTASWRVKAYCTANFRVPQYGSLSVCFRTRIDPGLPTSSSACRSSFDSRVPDPDAKDKVVGLQAGRTVCVSNNQMLRTCVTGPRSLQARWTTLTAKKVGVTKMPSSIEWTDETWNPVTGCSRVSPGCDNCYMFALYPRLKGMSVPGYDARPDVVQLQPGRLNLPLTWKQPRRVFVNSMSDAFHRDVPDDYVLSMFQVMKQSIDHAGHVFQILTKRPGRAVAWWQEHSSYFPEGWPENIWLGTSVENQKYTPRLTVLARVPAPIRFASIEPFLGPVDLTAWLSAGALSWVIVGGESGQRARSMDLKWLDSLKSQCEKSHVPLFVKQLGTLWARAKGSSDPKGGAPADWPEGITSREYPLKKKLVAQISV